ncbi:MAG: AglZ/HisF2 family acetamidino modification protein [Actinomycetota bacterium]
MLQSRVIPFLLLRNKGLVKTVKFGDDKYIGDPQNAIRIFNEKEVDELCFLDIDASVKGVEPDYEMIAKAADECRMPLTYGGGVTSADQAERILRLGVEKVAVSTAAVRRPRLITEIAERIGAQSVAVVLDVRRRRLQRNRYELALANGKDRLGLDPVAFAEEAVRLGAGEIVVNSIDLDGTMEGYDLGLARSVRAAVDTPMTVVGGAGTLDDVAELIDAIGPVGAGAGSLFVYKGVYKAVLINYAKP